MARIRGRSLLLLLALAASSGVPGCGSGREEPAAPGYVTPVPPGSFSGRLRVLLRGPRDAAAGARVEVWRGPRLLAVATADRSGSAFFPVLEAGEVQLIVRRDGWIGRNTWMRVPSGGLEIAEVRIGPAETLAGRVLDASDGSPVSGAEVEAFFSFLVGFDLDPTFFGRLDDRLGGTVTDAAGAFRLEDLPPGSDLLLVRVRAPGYRTTIRQGAGVESIGLTPGATISGRVTDRLGRGFPGAWVLAIPCEWGGRCWEDVPVFVPIGSGEGYLAPGAVTDADGRYLIVGVGRGDHYTIRASAEGRADACIEDVRAPAFDADLRLRPGSGYRSLNILQYFSAERPRGNREVTGVVLRPDGTPLAGALVSLSPAGAWTRTEADGTFRIDQIPAGRGTLTVSLRSDEETVAEVPVQIPGDPVRITALCTALRATVLLPLPAGPTTRIRVRNSSTENRHEFEAEEGSRRVSVEVPAAPGPVAIRFEAEGYRPVDWSGSVAEGQVLDVGEIRVEPWREIRGRVVDEAGGPVAGASVSSSGPTVTTGTGGEFRLVEFYGEPGALRVRAEGYLESHRPLPAGEEGILVRLARGVPVRVSVRDGEGNPLARVRVALLRRDRGIRQTVEDATTATDGTAALIAAPGVYELEAKTPWGTSVSRPLVLDLARPPAPLTLVVPR